MSYGEIGYTFQGFALPLAGNMAHPVCYRMHPSAVLWQRSYH